MTTCFAGECDHLSSLDHARSLRHRRAGSSVTFVTGHEEIDKRRPSVNWRALATASDGLVIYMGLHNLPRIAEELMAGGLDGDTPVAVVQQGTVAGQRCLKSPLREVAAATRTEKFASPSIVVMGDVVNHQVQACGILTMQIG